MWRVGDMATKMGRSVCSGRGRGYIQIILYIQRMSCLKLHSVAMNFTMANCTKLPPPREQCVDKSLCAIASVDEGQKCDAFRTTSANN